MVREELATKTQLSRPRREGLCGDNAKNFYTAVGIPKRSHTQTTLWSASLGMAKPIAEALAKQYQGEQGNFAQNDPLTQRPKTLRVGGCAVIPST